MSKTTMVRFAEHYYAAGEIKYAAGQPYPVTEDTERQVNIGLAEYVDVDLDGDKAARLAIEAQEAADRATALMAQAQAAAEAATEAQRLADEAAAAITPDAPVKGTKPKKTQTSAQAAPANGDPAAAS